MSMIGLSYLFEFRLSDNPPFGFHQKFTVVQTFRETSQEIVETVCIGLLPCIVTENEFLAILLQMLRTGEMVNTFYASFDMTPKSLYRVRVVAVHCIDVPAMRNGLVFVVLIQGVIDIQVVRYDG